MTTDTRVAAARIGAADIETAAREGVARALAARTQATELSADEIDAVSGGLTLASIQLAQPNLVLKPGILAGPYPVDVLKGGVIAAATVQKY